MEETKRNIPSFPTNYVTLVQLRERWMKQKEQQQHRKQNENEDDEQQTEKPEVAVSVCVASCESERTEKKKKVRKGKYREREWRKVRAAEDHQVNGRRGGGSATHAPEQAIVEDVVVADPTVEIEGKFLDMLIDDGNENSVRPRNRSFYRVKNGSNGNNNRLRDREGRQTKNARRMAWVKKGDNFGGASISNKFYQFDDGIEERKGP